jgi:lipopolysaccharide/colanic/teichoic acid biosynthesis glycosyltransferase
MRGQAQSAMSDRDNFPGRVLVGRLRAVSAEDEAQSAERAVGRRLKRAFDVMVAGSLLLVVAVPLLLIAIAIKLDSRGPVFHRVRRVGYRGRPLLMLKLRKMHHDAGGMPLTADQDSRLTRVGTMLARTRLDELPQLWDVLRGRMSIVGPRPEDPVFVALHSEAYDRILRVRPGITGLSQVAFAEEHKILDQSNLVDDYVGRILPQKVGLDVLYSDSYRLRTDLAVVSWTLAAIALRRQVAVHRATGAMNLRHRQHLARVADARSMSSEPVADAA